MRTAALISLFLMAGVVLGFVVGRQFESSSPGYERPPAPIESLVESSPTSTAPRVELGAPVETPAAPERALSRTSEAVPVAVSYEEPAPIRGTGVITGKVRTDSGQPLPGVTLIADPQRTSERSGSRKYRGPPAEQDLSAKIDELVERHQWESARRTRTTTGGDGSFRFEGLAAGRWTVSGYKEGYELHTADGSDRTNIRPGAHVQLDAWEIVEVPVNVVRSDGTQPPSATIRWTSRGSRRRFSYDWKPTDPSAQFRLGVHTVSATAGEHQELRSEEVELDLGEGAAPGELTLTLRPRAGIRGRVVFPDGLKPDNAPVWALRYEGKAPDHRTLREDGQNSWASEHNAFQFSFSDLEAGSYLIGVGLSWQSVVASVSVEVGDEIVEQDIEIPPFAPDEHFVLWAYGPDGSLAEDVHVSLEVRVPRGGSRSKGAEALKRADGALIVVESEWPEEAAQDEAKRFVNVRSSEYGAVRLEYAKGTPELEVRFQEPAELEVVVSGHDSVEGGKKVQLALVREERSEDGVTRRDHAAGSDRITPEGIATLGPVEPGDYLLTLSISGARRYGAPLAETPVRLKAGRNSARIAVPRLYRLTLAFGPDRKGTRVQLQGEDGRHVGGEQVGEDGDVTFGELKAGTYKVMTYGRGTSEFMEVSVQSDRLVEFEAATVNALRVTVRDRGGALAKAGFQDGDLIVAVEGQEFENMQQMQLVFVTVLAKESAKMTVLRGRRRVEIEVDPRTLQGADQGGSVQPASR